MFEIDLQEHSDSIVDIVVEFMQHNIFPKKLNPSKYLRSWCIYLTHCDLYCLTHFLPTSQKSIRGKMSYKLRKSS